jgi:hypothetical protein
VKHIYLVATALAVSASALADTPAEERDFGEFAAAGCKNRNGDFVIRGLVSSANESTLVLADTTNSGTTTSVGLPRTKLVERLVSRFATAAATARTPVVVTMECKDDGTPIAQEISYTKLDGTHGNLVLIH